MKDDNIKDKLASPTPIRFTINGLNAVNEAAEKLDFNLQETVRFLCRVGIACLDKCNYKLPEEIAKKALDNCKSSKGKA